MGTVALLVICTPIFVWLAVRRNQRRLAAAGATDDVTVDRDGARRLLSDGRVEEVSWEEVVEVDVFTTRKGPHRHSGGAVVLYGDHERGCVIPLDWLERSNLLVHLGRLEGFKSATLLDALRGGDADAQAVTANPLVSIMPRPWSSNTVVWKRPGTEGTRDWEPPSSS